MTSDRRHFRASEVPTVLYCSGSAFLTRRVREARRVLASAAALMGTWCHADGALGLIEKHGATNYGPPIVRPAEYKSNAFAEWISRYYQTAVAEHTSADMAMEVEAEFDSDILGGGPDAPTDIPAFSRFQLTGHIDCFAMTADGTEAIGFDLKAGINIVTEAGDNAQVLAYIVLLKLAYPTLRKVTFYIVQPQNDPDSGVDRITEIVVDGEDKLRGAVAYLERELNYACDHPYDLNSDGPRPPCGNCAAKLVCPAYRGDLEPMKLSLTKEAFDAIKLHPDPTELGRIELAARKFKPLFEAAHDELAERIGENGLDVDGVKLVRETRAGRRKITDNLMADAALRDLPHALRVGTYEYKPAAIEDALAEHLKLPKKSVKGHDAKKEYNARFGHFTEQGQSVIIKIV